MANQQPMYDFAPYYTSRACEQVAYYDNAGVMKQVDIPECPYPSPLAPNIPPQTLLDMRNSLLGKKSVYGDRGYEVWESWKRAWDLWNNHYIEGREDPVWIKKEYFRLKDIIDKERAKQRPFRQTSPTTPDPNKGEKPGSLNAIFGGRTKKSPGAAGGSGGGGGNSTSAGNGGYAVVDRKIAVKSPENPPAGMQWIRHPFRTGIIMIDDLSNAPPQGALTINKDLQPAVQDYEPGDVVPRFRREGIVGPPFSEQRVVRDGTWLKDLRGWADVVADRTLQKTHVDLDLGVEPTESHKVMAECKRVPKAFVENWVKIEDNELYGWETMVLDRCAVNRGKQSQTKHTGSDMDGFYVLKEIFEWRPVKYNLVPTGLIDIAVDREFAVEILVPTIKNTFETLPTPQKPVRAPQWLLVNKAPPGPSAPNTPPEIAMDKEILKKRDHHLLLKWTLDFKARWNVVNPNNLTGNTSFNTWKDSLLDAQQQAWTALNFQSPAHSNGGPSMTECVTRPLSMRVETVEASDEDMAEVWDQEIEEIYDEDNEDDDMLDGPEQRTLPGTTTDPNDKTNEPVDTGTGKVHDDCAGGFLPMRLYEKYKLPAPDYAGEWTDKVQNTVWRPRRVGEKVARIDTDEPGQEISDLEVDGGFDCGREPYPVMRAVNKYSKHEVNNCLSYHKEKIWDGVDHTIFNMPTKPDEDDSPLLDKQEQTIQTIYSNPMLPGPTRHNLFPLDIRRIVRVDPVKETPLKETTKLDVPPGEKVTEIDLPWICPMTGRRDLKETDPWYFTPEQEKLRDCPPRRHPYDDGHGKRLEDKHIILDKQNWNENLELDFLGHRRYYVTNLHGGTLIINGAEVKKGHVAGPLPPFAIIESPGGQISFWFGVNGRNWRSGTEGNLYIAAWSAIRRMEGMENFGLNAAAVWNDLIKNRLLREQTGNTLEDDDEWDGWKSDPPYKSSGTWSVQTANKINASFAGGLGNPIPAKRTYRDKIELDQLGAPTSAKKFKLPDSFIDERLELKWLQTRVEPIRDALRVNATPDLSSLSLISRPDDSSRWPGPDEEEPREVAEQNFAEEGYIEAQTLQCQTEFQERLTNWRLADSDKKTADVNTKTDARSRKRQAEDVAKQEEVKRKKQKLDQDVYDSQTAAVQNMARAQQEIAGLARQEKFMDKVAKEAVIIHNACSKTKDRQGAIRKRKNEYIDENMTKRQRITDANVKRIQLNQTPIPITGAETRAELATEYDDISKAVETYIDNAEKAKPKLSYAFALSGTDPTLQKMKAAMLARTVELRADQKAVTLELEQEKKAQTPTTEADIGLSNRYLRHNAATARWAAQQISDAADNQKADAARRQQQAKDESERQQRADDAKKAAQARQALQPATTTVPPPATTMAPPPTTTTAPSQAPKLSDVDQEAQNQLESYARAAGQTVDAWLASIGKHKTAAEYRAWYSAPLDSLYIDKSIPAGKIKPDDATQFNPGRPNCVFENIPVTSECCDEMTKLWAEAEIYVQRAILARVASGECGSAVEIAWKEKFEDVDAMIHTKTATIGTHLAQTCDGNLTEGQKQDRWTNLSIVFDTLSEWSTVVDQNRPVVHGRGTYPWIEL